MNRSTLERLSRLLPSSRPKWAMMPSAAATHFTDLLLFIASALDHVGIEYIVHYGTLLGAARLAAPLPWDEDHDLFVIDIDIETVRERLEPIVDQAGYCLTFDPRGFLWVRDRLWPAASGHLSLTVLPVLEPFEDGLPVWEGGAPHLVEGELRPLRLLPIYGSFIHAPAATERILARLYGPSAGPDVMQAFVAPPLLPEAASFWARHRTTGGLDWPAIEDRFRRRSRWAHLRFVPWWWFNGAYIIWINKIRTWARRRLAG